jgi:hypothetical protein
MYMYVHMYVMYYLQFVLRICVAELSSLCMQFVPTLLGKIKILWVLKTSVLVTKNRIMCTKYNILFLSRNIGHVPLCVQTL